MAIEKRWINWSTAISGAVLLVFALAQLVVSFYMNLTASTNRIEKTNISGAMLVSLGVLIFPTCWIAFASAISRHRGVYIALVVMTSLSVLDAIGMLVYQTYRFSMTAGYTDNEKGISITMCVLHSILIVILIFVLAFASAALCTRCPEHSNYHQKRERGGYQGPYYNSAPPMYPIEGYRMSLPRGAWDYATEPRQYYSKGGRY